MSKRKQKKRGTGGIFVRCDKCKKVQRGVRGGGRDVVPCGRCGGLYATYDTVTRKEAAHAADR